MKIEQTDNILDLCLENCLQNEYSQSLRLELFWN